MNKILLLAALPCLIAAHGLAWAQSTPGMVDYVGRTLEKNRTAPKPPIVERRTMSEPRVILDAVSGVTTIVIPRKAAPTQKRSSKHDHHRKSR